MAVFGLRGLFSGTDSQERPPRETEKEVLPRPRRRVRRASSEATSSSVRGAASVEINGALTLGNGTMRTQDVRASDRQPRSTKRKSGRPGKIRVQSSTHRRAGRVGDAAVCHVPRSAGQAGLTTASRMWHVNCAPAAAKFSIYGLGSPAPVDCLQ